jgi:hypothetical protein
MSGKYRPPLYFMSISVVIYIFLAVLELMGMNSPWIDRVIVFEIFTTALFTSIAMIVGTDRWSLRGLGIWGFMFAIVISYIASQMVLWGLLSLPLPFYISNIWRSMLALAGPLMIYGYYRWTQGRALDDHPMSRDSHERTS